MPPLRALATALIPPLCAACGCGCRPREVLCAACASRLAASAPLSGSGPPGVDRAWAAAAHQGVARDLVVALKFRRLLPVAALMAERIARQVPAALLGGVVVPVPPAPLRSLRRGFDPAGELAADLAERLGVPFQPCLARRGGRRQVGKRRAERLGRPPRIGACGEAPRSVLLVDDVLTTGATISACAAALRSAGALRIVALTFSRRP